jgi:hypothetical protein
MRNPKKAPKVNTDKAALYQALFNTPNGKKVWKDLVEEFNPDDIFVKGDAHETHLNLGKREAYNYINQLLRIDTND